MMAARTEIPLHKLEAARNRLEGLFRGEEGDCCLFDIDPDHIHDDATYVVEMDPDYITLRDLLDDVIREQSR